MFDRIPSTTGVEVHRDLGMDVNYRTCATGNPVEGGPGAAQPADPIAGGPYVPEEFEHRSPPPGGRPGTEGGAPGGPPPGFGAGANVGGASAGMAMFSTSRRPC